MQMVVDLEESVDGLDEDDADDCEGEVNDSGEDLIAKDALVFALDLVEEFAEGAEREDDEGKGEDDDGEEEVVDESCHDLHF